MYSFRNDYSEGVHPQILQALTETNLVQTCGYGMDDEVPEHHFSTPTEDVTRAYLRDETHRAVHRALGRLIDSHREVLWLVYFENLSVKEAAEVLGKSPHAAESLIHRARLSMKAELEKEGITHEDL